MANHFPCHSCGGAIAFEEWERGTEVYCPSCGQPSRVAVLDEATGAELEAGKDEARIVDAATHLRSDRERISVQQARPAPEVFVQRADPAIGSRVIEERDCPRCGAKVPITITDHGGSTYCLACGTELPVGEALVIQSAPSPVIALPRAPERAPRPPRRSRVVLFTAALIVLAGTLWLVQASTQPLRPLSVPKSSQPKPVPSPDAHITLKAIAGLATMEPPGEALAQAEDWKQFLADIKVPETDPRLANLEAAIAVLRDKVLPKSQPDPPEVAEFLQQVRALAEALNSLLKASGPDAPGLPAGHAATAKADQLLALHPEMLDPVAHTFRQMSAEFRKIAAKIEGTKPIEGLLKTAGDHVEANRPTEALEALAQARQLTLATELDDLQREQLARRHNEITNGPLQLSLCRRSLALAEQATHTGDLHAREWLAREAQSHLNVATYRAPNTDCAAVISRIKALNDAPPAGPGRSSRIPEFEARRAYEQAIESFATWRIDDASRWIECAHDFDEVASRLPSSKADSVNRLATLLLQGLRAWLDLPRELGRDDARTAEALISVNEALAVVKRWQSRPDYRMLLVELHNRGTELARRLVDSGEQQLRTDRPDEGLILAEGAAGLTWAADGFRARKLIERCKAEIAARSDRQAQDEAWAKLKPILDKREPLDTWDALARFERRFPKSARTKEIAAIRQTIDAEIRRQVPALLKKCDDYARNKQFADYRRAVDRLETLPHGKGDGEFETHRRRLADLDREVESRFAKIPTRIDSRPQLVEALDELAAVLALNPDHPGALARRSKAWEQARPYVTGMLRAAELTARQHRLTNAQLDSQVRSLDMVLKLTPPGPTLDRANELIKLIKDPRRSIDRAD